MLMRNTSSPISGLVPGGFVKSARSLACALMIGGSVTLLAGCSSWFSTADDVVTATPDMSTGGWSEAVANAPRIAPPPPKNSIRNDIVAVVNDQPVTSYDLDQRARLIMVTSGIPNTPEMRKKVRHQALDQLIEETLRRQAAQKNEMTVSSVDVNKRIAQIRESSHLSMDQLRQLLQRGGVAMASFRSQIATQLLWQRLVQQQFAGRVNISPDTVDAQMKRIAESANKVHYDVSEIFVAVDNPEQDAKAKADAEGYYEQIKAGAPFAAIARQFSQSPSAAQGGNIGVVYDGQMAPVLSKALDEMKTDGVSKPIRAIGGYYILRLNQRYEPYGTKVDTFSPEEQTLPEKLPLGRLLLPLPPNAPAKLKDNAMKIAHTLVPHITSCKVLPMIAKEIQGSVYMDLGNVRIADLSRDIRGALQKSRPGEAVEPFLSDAGVELFVRCDKKIPIKLAFHMPTRNEVESQLFEEQIGAMARRFNRDLKRDADIEIKDPEYKEKKDTPAAATPAPKDAPKDGKPGPQGPKDGKAPPPKPEGQR